MRPGLLLGALLLAVPAAGLAQDTSKAVQQRKEINTMADNALAELYRQNPEAKADIGKAAGVGVFSEMNFTLGPATGGGGRGVVRNRATGKQTFMRVAEAGGGLGLGVKDVRNIFVFDTKEALETFTTKGWNFGGDANASAKAAGKGGAANAAFQVASGVRLYQLTKGGLALKATLSGTKYWADADLNSK
jgi:lipid-binding SYLF domain-containing protein